MSDIADDTHDTRDTDDTDDTDDGAAQGRPSDIGYADAIAELDEILRDLERTDVDVDVLADRVARAAVLIDLCRTRIGSARLQIEQVVADLEDTGARVDDDRR